MVLSMKAGQMQVLPTQQTKQLTSSRLPSRSNHAECRQRLVRTNGFFFNSQVDQTKSLFAFVTSLDDKHGCVNVCSVRYEMNADVVGLE